MKEPEKTKDLNRKISLLLEEVRHLLSQVSKLNEIDKFQWAAKNYIRATKKEKQP